MTEQGIVDVLKGNKTKGIAYLFLPEDVKDWIQSHRNDNKLMILTEDGDFSDGGLKPSYGIIATDVFALPDDYEPKQEQKDEWVEFKINKFGRFTDYNVDDDNHQISFSFGWHQWSEFLECSYEHGFGYTTFGGWQYEGSDWNTYPLIQCGNKASSGVSFSMDDKPMIPKKIRFWRKTND